MMNAVRRSLTAALAACVVLSGCAGGGDRATDPTEAAVEPDVDPSEEPSREPSQEPSAPSTHSPVVAAAVADLAAAQGVDEAEVDVVSEEKVTWRDGSLGCAKRGMSYTQALVDGSRIVLRLGGKDYEYHSGGGGAPFHCQIPTE